MGAPGGYERGMTYPTLVFTGEGEGRARFGRRARGGADAHRRGDWAHDTIGQRSNLTH